MLSRIMCVGRSHIAVAGFVLVAALAHPASLRAQGLSGPTVADSRVGYIDSALVGNQIRLRYDAGFDLTRANRAEFIYPKPQPGGPGFPRPERSVDIQDATIYAETLITDRFSVFADLGVRFINPEINDNSGGLSDMNAGLRYEFYRTCDVVSTFQLRAYAPTGDGDRGLGTQHASIEPAVLVYARLSDRLALESELRYWIPLGGTDFAGDVVRYGVGLRYDIFRFDNGAVVSPVVEFVGWTVLDGQQSSTNSAGRVIVADAAGDTILNAKLGARVGITDRSDFYAGYGRSLTGDQWYRDVFRLELRIRY